MRTSLTRCVCGGKKPTAIGEGRFLYVRGGDGPTHISTARTGRSSADTCSAFHVQKGRKSQQRTYQNEKRENYPIVSGFRNKGMRSAHPMISSQSKRTLSFPEMSSAGVGASGMTYLIAQG